MSSDTEPKPTSTPSAAFLIVIRQIFPLDRETVKVGRGLENQLVIDDPSVSRQHVNIHTSSGEVVIQDLDSSGGTYVNGKQVTQELLRSGDIISLAGVTMLYVEDHPQPMDTSRLRFLQR
jgi:pSer/pThr/pTyr-binding forkhead associated (FHA) protein